MKKLYLLCGIHRWYKVFLYVLGYFTNRKSAVFKLIDQDLQLAASVVASGAQIKNSFFSNFFAIQIADRKLHLRKSSSDLHVFDQIFLREEYKEALEIILQKLQINSGPVIIDAGANIGCSAIYLSRFQGLENSLVVSLEPFPETTQLLKKNLSANLPIFQVVPAALWSKETSILFDMNFRDGKEWSVRTVEDANGPVKAIAIQSIFDQFNLQEIDIFKIDIEGSEFEVFLNSNENVKCLSNIRSVIMEIHDDAGKRSELYHVFQENGFEITELGELTLFLNKNFIRS